MSKKENSQAMKIKIKISKESSQVKNENSQSLKILVEYKLVKVRFPCPTGSHFGRAVSELNIFFVKYKFFWNKLRNIFQLIKKIPRLSGRPKIHIGQEKSIDGAPKWR